MSGEDWSNIIMSGNDIALQWYATVQQVPIATQRPTSVVGAITGSDLSRGTSGAIGTGGTVLILGLVVVGAILIFR